MHKYQLGREGRKTKEGKTQSQTQEEETQEEELQEQLFYVL